MRRGCSVICHQVDTSSDRHRRLPAICSAATSDENARALVIRDVRSSGTATPSMKPGTHFQTFVLENYYCPVVRPLIPCATRIFSGYPKRMGLLLLSVISWPEASIIISVPTLRPFMSRPTSPMSSLHLLLPKLSSSTSSGSAFLPLTGSSSASTVTSCPRCSMPTPRRLTGSAGNISNFESGGPTMARLQPGTQHGNLPDQESAMQLHTTTFA